MDKTQASMRAQRRASLDLTTLSADVVRTVFAEFHAAAEHYGIDGTERILRTGGVALLARQVACRTFQARAWREWLDRVLGLFPEPGDMAPSFRTAIGALRRVIGAVSRHERDLVDDDSRDEVLDSIDRARAAAGDITSGNARAHAYVYTLSHVATSAVWLATDEQQIRAGLRVPPDAAMFAAEVLAGDVTLDLADLAGEEAALAFVAGLEALSSANDNAAKKSRKGGKRRAA